MTIWKLILYRLFIMTKKKGHILFIGYMLQVITMNIKIAIYVTDNRFPNWDMRKKIISIPLKVKAFDRKHIFDAIEEEDIYDIVRKSLSEHFETDITEIPKYFGNTSIISYGSILASFIVSDDPVKEEHFEPYVDNTYTGLMCAQVYGGAEQIFQENLKRRDNNTPIYIDGTEYNIDFIIYREGFVISTGRELGGLASLYRKSNSYLNKITSKNVKNSALDAAKTFDTMKDVVKYLEKYCGTLMFCVEHYNYHVDVDYVTEQFKDSVIKARMDGILKDSVDCCKADELLDYINGIEKKGASYPDSGKGKATFEEQEEEAIRRLKVLGCNELAKMLPNIRYSEFKGIWYDITTKMRETITELTNRGYFVYHIIKTNTTDGEFYDYLTISPYKEDWSYERPDGIDNRVVSQCYTPLNYFEGEGGSIWVDMINGGLIRRISA